MDMVTDFGIPYNWGVYWLTEHQPVKVESV